MLREIKFRGKYVGTGEWVYGGYFKATFCDGRGERTFIKEHGSDRTEVDPNTVGQYTGVADKDGTPIYEGDIVRCQDDEAWGEPEPDAGTRHKVIYMGSQDYPAFELSPSVDVDSNGLSHFIAQGTVKVEGNIHDNSELLHP